MKYIVWVKEDGKWVENGDGPMTEKTAKRVEREIRKETGCPAKALPVGMEPEQKDDV
jgi:hypothetical protein